MPKLVFEYIFTSRRQESKHSRVLFLLKSCNHKLIFPAESLKNIWLIAMSSLWWVCNEISFLYFTFLIFYVLWWNFSLLSNWGHYFVDWHGYLGKLASVQSCMTQIIAKWQLANFCLHEKETAYYQVQLDRKGYIVSNAHI